MKMNKSILFRIVALGAAIVGLFALGVAREASWAMGKVPADAIRDQLAEYKNVLLSYFRTFNLLPILLPADQQPGDVFDMRQMGVYRARARECFPTLETPSGVDSALTYTFAMDTNQLGLALGLERIISINAEAGLERSAVVNYTNVKVFSVSLQALANAASDVCPDVKEIAKQSIVVTEPPKLVPVLAIIGTLVTAKRQVFIDTKSNVDVTGSAQRISNLLAGIGLGSALKVIGVDPSVSMAVGLGAKRGVLLQGDQQLPVAFAPAFVPELMLPRSPTAPIPIQWKPFDATKPADAARLQSMISNALQN